VAPSFVGCGVLVWHQYFLLLLLLFSSKPLHFQNSFSILKLVIGSPIL
jgi:hypothetical protein